MLNTILDIVSFKEIGFFTPAVQILIVCVLFIITLIRQKKRHVITGFTWGRYPWRLSTFLSSYYEEIIFRVFILFGLLSFLPSVYSIIFSSVLFGLWHLKNYKWQSKKETLSQVLYTGFIFGPIACFVTLGSGTIWMAVIAHYAHNILAHEFNDRQKTHSNTR